jgi:hypothetical protein
MDLPARVLYFSMPPKCKECRIELSGDYTHWSISGFPYCDICFDLLLIVTSSRWLKMCQLEHVLEMARRRAILRGN